MHDWPGHARDDIPSPRLVAAWSALGMLPTERVPRWAAFWLAHGHDGAALVELAGLHGDDPREVHDLLPAALADCRTAVPTTDADAATEVFVDLAHAYADGEITDRWLVDKVAQVLARSGYANEVIELPLGQLYGLDDEWGSGWGRSDTELRAVISRACQDQLRLDAAQ